MIRRPAVRGGLALMLAVGCAVVGRGDGAGETASVYESTLRDAVDAAAPDDIRTAKRLRLAETFLAEGRPDRAREALLLALDEAGGSFVRLGDGRLVPATDEINALFGRLPADALDLYRRQFDAAASKALDAAIASGRQEAVARVAEQFRHTAAGIRAAERQGAVRFDRGEFGSAAREYRRLLDAGVRLSPPSRVRAEVAFFATGESDRPQLLKSLAADPSVALTERLDLDSLLAAVSEAGGRRPAADWPMPFGDPSRSALAADAEPLLLERWSRPLADRGAVRDRAARIATDLRDGGRAAVPVAEPVAVGNRVAVRTLSGVAVLDVETGEPLWETGDPLSPEQILSGGVTEIPDPQANQVLRWRQPFGPDPSDFAGAERDPLLNLLYRDGLWGLLSSDGDRLFVIEDHAALTASDLVDPFDNRLNPDRYGRDRSSNRLMAYDLESGRPAWPGRGVGGAASGGPFETPLAGYYFFGPPTPVGDELLVVGERNKEIRLLGLDPRDGRPLWDRLVGNAQAGIAEDPVRRGWAVQPAVAGGVIVCPTTVGWLIAFDQASRAPLWAYRYSPVQPERQGDAGRAVPNSPLGSRWCPAAPIIVGNRIVFAPPEEARLVCLDLATGKLLWQQGKGNNLYVAGVAGDAVVTVGTGPVTAISLNDGSVRWSASIPDSAGPPSGRGLLTKDRLYLPLRGESLWTIDLARGEATDRKEMASASGTLGNLLLHGRTLLSVGPAGMTAFEERGALVRSIAARLAADPSDAAALLDRAGLERAEGDPTAAAATLAAVEPAKLPPSRRKAAQAETFAVLASLIEADGAAHADLLPRLAAAASTANERLTVRRLEAERLAAADPLEATRAFLGLLDEAAEFVEADGVSVRLDAWVGGRLAAIREAAGPEVRQAIATLSRERFEAAAGAQRDRLAEAFRGNPDLSRTRFALAADAAQAGRFFEAENRLLRLARATDPAAAADARLKLVELYRDAELPSDAAAELDAVERSKLDAALPDGRTLADAVAALRRTLKPSGSTPTVSDWGGGGFEAVRSGGQYTSETTTEISPDNATLPYFRDHFLRLALPQNRLTVHGGGRLERLIPLRSDGGSRSAVRSAVAGHDLFLYRDGAVQAVSPVEGRVVWTASLTDANARGRVVMGLKTMRTAAALAGTAGLVPSARQSDPLVAANADYVAVRDDRTLKVYDTLDGRLRWSLPNVPRSSVLVGTASRLYVVPQNLGPETVVRDAADGHRSDVADPRSALMQAVAAVGDRLLTLRTDRSLTLFGFGQTRTHLTLVDPVSGETQAGPTLPIDALYDLLPDGRLAILKPDGLLEAFDPASGETAKLGEVPADLMGRRHEAFVFRDADSTFLIVNDSQPERHLYSAGVASLPVSGEVFAFDDAGAVRWRRAVASQRFLPQETNAMPVLLFGVTRRAEKGDDNVYALDLLAIDKRTGESAFDDPTYFRSPPSLRAVTVDAESRAIQLDLSSYNVRLRLQAVP